MWVLAISECSPLHHGEVPTLAGEFVALVGFAGVGAPLVTSARERQRERERERERIFSVALLFALQIKDICDWF